MLAKSQVAPMWRQTTPMAVTASRSYVTANKYSRDEVLEKLDNFHGEVLSANWGDYLYLVYNGPFWEAEFERLKYAVQGYIGEEGVGAKWSECQEMMDALYCCEDVRDHLNELAELKTRSSGLMGTGWQAGAPVENLEENAVACAEAYDKVL